MDRQPLRPRESLDRQKVLFLTAGAAGMYCGSCLHDNELARALGAAGHECILQPVYTPIRTDEESVARDAVFFGGIHIYLIDRFPAFARLPRWCWKWLDSPRLLRWITRRAQSTDPQRLGHLTQTMLDGASGTLSDEVNRLGDWIAAESPDRIILGNLLIGGCLPTLAQRVPDARRIVLLQGDDIFLDHLPPSDRDAVIGKLRALVPHLDVMVVNSRYYAGLMADILDVPVDRFEITPLSVATSTFDSRVPDRNGDSDAFRIAYLARVAPEKGLDQLVDAFVRLASDDPSIHLDCGGYLAASNQAYFDRQVEKIRRAGLEGRFRHWGEVTAEEKRALLAGADVLSVPTRYLDPKGLFVLEANASGTPVVQPDHGAFGELIEQTGGGLVYDPDDPSALVETLARIRRDDALRQRLAKTGHERTHAGHSIDQAAERLLAF